MSLSHAKSKKRLEGNLNLLDPICSKLMVPRMWSFLWLLSIQKRKKLYIYNLKPSLRTVDKNRLCLMLLMQSMNEMTQRKNPLRLFDFCCSFDRESTAMCLSILHTKVYILFFLSTLYCTWHVWRYVYVGTCTSVCTINVLIFISSRTFLFEVNAHVCTVMMDFVELIVGTRTFIHSTLLWFIPLVFIV